MSSGLFSRVPECFRRREARFLVSLTRGVHEIPVIVGEGMRHAVGRKGAATTQGVLRGVVFGGTFFLAGCTALLTGGTDGEGSGGPPGAEGPPPPYAPPVGPLRRLTRTQFRNALRDVTGIEVDIAGLDADSFDGDLAAVGASTVVTSSRGVELYHAAIEGVTDQLFSSNGVRDGFVGCVPAAPNDACTSGFLERLARRAWRRPANSEELGQLANVATVAATELSDPFEGARWATVAVLESPNFLYRPELGEAKADGSYRLTAFEVATRVAFLVWNGPPDDELLDAAAGGLLGTPEGLLAQVDRLLAAPKGREAASAFAEDFMRLDRVVTQPKDTALFPEYGPSLQNAMVQDMREVWALVAFDDDASVLDVFSTKRAFVNAELAELYGLDATGLDATTFRAMTLPAETPRLGVLGKPGFLSQFANQKEGSPTLRGKFIREALMCEHVSPPPEAVALEIPESINGVPSTKRDRLALHRSSPGCAGCHALMDPLGLPLETYDAIGRYRTTEQGLPIDSSGEFDGVPVADATELGVVMSESEKVAECIVRKFYSYAVGHDERDVDATVVDALATSFAESGHHLRSLVRALVTSDAFTSVAPQL